MKFHKQNNIINEKDFSGVLSELKSLRPETHFDEGFSSNLKSRLLDNKPKLIISPYRSIFASRIFYSVLGSALTILVSIPLAFMSTPSEITSSRPLIFNLFQVKNITSGLSPKQQINNKGVNAFGILKPIASTSTPEQIQEIGVTYAYSGAPVELKEADVTVFKRTKDAGLKAVYQNGDQTKKPASVLASSVTSDAGLISLSNIFLQNHSIDTSVYDAPIVMKIASSTDNAFLDSVSVLYPLLIDGKKVYTVSGSLYGISATIDTLQNQVSSIDNLTTQVYDSSAYKPETDFNKIFNVATSTLSAQIANKNVFGAVTLGTSSPVLLQYWFTNEKTGTDDELYIPALAFPVTYENASAGLPSVVVVPIVKDFLVLISLNSSQK